MVEKLQKFKEKILLFFLFYYKSYIWLENINFDSKELRKKLEKLDQDIQKTDFEISKLNSIEFEI